MINMGSVQAFVEPILKSSGITDALTVHWVEDCLMLGGARFVSREEVQSGEYKNTLARKIANYKAGSPNPYAEWRTVFGIFPNVVKDYCQVSDDNWELPSEYRQYAEMIAVWNLSLLDRAWQEWRDVEGFASFPGKTYSVRPTPIPGKDDNSEPLNRRPEPYDDWAGFQPLGPAIKSIGADPRSESLAKALRFT